MRHTELLTSRQVAEMFAVSVATIGRWARDGSLPSVRTPSDRLRFRPEDVQEALSRPGDLDRSDTAGAA